MATTSIWPVRGYLSNLVIYVENSEKTEQPKMAGCPSVTSAGAQSLDDVISYAMESRKTVESESDQNNRCYVSGINCTPTGARDQMMRTKKRFGKADGIVAYHGYQSFKPGEVTPDVAHSVGVELAEKLWGDRFEIIVATHLDRSHVHNHLLVNSVSFTDGLRFRSNKTTYGKLRAESDRICRERGFSVIERLEYGKAKQYGEWRAEKDGGLSWKEAIRADIDFVLKRSVTHESFVARLEKMGYEIKWGKELSVKAPDRERFLRPARHFGVEYSTEAIILKLQQNYRTGAKGKPRPELSTKIKREIREKLQGHNPHSLATRHYRYYLVIAAYSVIPKSDQAPNLRTETMAIESLMRQAMMLIDFSIETIEELLKLKNPSNKDLHHCKKNAPSFMRWLLSRAIAKRRSRREID